MLIINIIVIVIFSVIIIGYYLSFEKKHISIQAYLIISCRFEFENVLVKKFQEFQYFSCEI